MYSQPLTEASAAKIGREWIKNRAHLPADSLCQRRWLLDQLVKLCITESLKENEDEDGLCERISATEDILSSVWYLGAPRVATQWRRSDGTPDADDQKQIAAAQKVLWIRHDPLLAFREGFDSKHYTSIDKDELHSVIASYLSRPWLRHPVLDWIFEDMMITGELCSYGETLKQHGLPGPRDRLLGVHARYYEAKGNLTEMKKFDLKNSWLGRNWLAIATPVAAVWAAFHYGYYQTGWWLLGIGGTLWGVELSYKVIKWTVRLMRKISGRDDPKDRFFRLWDEMYKVWRLLEGPVVNPSMVREAMRNSAEKGAVWDAASWSLIDRIISIDGDVPLNVEKGEAALLALSC